VDRKRTFDIAGVPDPRRLKQHHLYFFLGHRTMFDTARNDNQISFVERHAFASELHPETPAKNHEKLIFFGMVVPDKLTFEFHKFDVLAVQFAYYARVPVIRKQRKLLADVYSVHGMRVAKAFESLLVP
jgi:hypothetical protein